MHWLTILLIGIAANLDNLGIGVSYSLKSTHIPFISNLFIAMISMISAYLSIAAGELIAHSISLWLANFSGGLIIIILGTKTVIESKKEEPTSSREPVLANSNFTKIVKEPENLDLNKDKIISWKESILLGLALAINCLAIGIGAGITGVSPVFSTISIGAFSLLSISTGMSLGRKMAGKRMGFYSNIAAGVLLILIGIYEMIF